MTTQQSLTKASELALIRESIREIDERVTPTICPTAKSDGNGGIIETREGRIHSDDFQTLMGYALGAVTLAEVSQALSPVSVGEEERAREWLTSRGYSHHNITGVWFIREDDVQSLAAEFRKAGLSEEPRGGAGRSEGE